MPAIEQLLYQTDKSIHGRCSIEKTVKTLQYSQENACVEVSFGTRLK